MSQEETLDPFTYSLTVGQERPRHPTTRQLDPIYLQLTEKAKKMIWK